MPIGDDYTELSSGIAFRFDNPTLDMVQLHDIAWSLSRTCRYNGHTRRHYSVAEHCVVMADWVAKLPGSTARDVLTALHHDDAECVIGDLIRPVKDKVPDFKTIENRIDELIARKFGTIFPLPAWLKEIDFRILHDERLEFMLKSGNIWASDKVPPLGVKFFEVQGRSAYLMRRKFIARHNYWTTAMWVECGLG